MILSFDLNNSQLEESEKSNFYNISSALGDSFSFAEKTKKLNEFISIADVDIVDDKLINFFDNWDTLFEEIFNEKKSSTHYFKKLIESTNTFKDDFNKLSLFNEIKLLSEEELNLDERERQDDYFNRRKELNNIKKATQELDNTLMKSITEVEAIKMNYESKIRQITDEAQKKRLMTEMEKLIKIHNELLQYHTEIKSQGELPSKYFLYRMVLRITFTSSIYFLVGLVGYLIVSGLSTPFGEGGLVLMGASGGTILVGLAGVVASGVITYGAYKMFGELKNFLSFSVAHLVLPVLVTISGMVVMGITAATSPFAGGILVASVATGMFVRLSLKLHRELIIIDMKRYPDKKKIEFMNGKINEFKGELDNLKKNI
jgi:hypothetical protein